jgi:hypothetical protein
MATVLVVGVFALSGASLGAAETTLTGTVGDAKCGVKHAMPNAEACTRGCVKGGSDYALIVSDKAYTLTATDAQKAELDKLAGKMAEIVGDVEGTTVTVKSVKEAANK